MSNNKFGIKVAISGKSGCGNTTISRMVSETLGLNFINFTFRNIAEEKGLELKEVLKLAAKDDSWDIEVDKRQVELAALSEVGCVIGSRIAIWMLPDADLKIFLSASAQVRAERIRKREGGNIEEITAFTLSRDQQDRERYLRLYNIDNNNYGFADLIIDTDKYNPNEIVDIIVDKIREMSSE